MMSRTTNADPVLEQADAQTAPHKLNVNTPTPIAVVLWRVMGDHSS
jgi:hypothetical protein